MWFAGLYLAGIAVIGTIAYVIRTALIQVGAGIPLQHGPRPPPRWQLPARLFRRRSVVCLSGLRTQPITEAFQVEMMPPNGVEPKTVDYMACLVTSGFVAIDSHISGSSREAGVEDHDCHSPRRILSVAADRPEVSGRAFDAWIWRQMKDAKSERLELQLRQSTPRYDLFSGGLISVWETVSPQDFWRSMICEREDNSQLPHT